MQQWVQELELKINILQLHKLSLLITKGVHYSAKTKPLASTTEFVVKKSQLRACARQAISKMRAQ